MVGAMEEGSKGCRGSMGRRCMTQGRRRGFPEGNDCQENGVLREREFVEERRAGGLGRVFQAEAAPL